MPTINQLFPRKWICADDLLGRDVRVVIENLTLEPVWSGDESKDKPILWFVGKNKGLVLNRTMAKVLAKLYGKQTEDWIGKPITLYPTTTKAFGETVEVVRIRPEVPATPAAVPVVNGRYALPQEENNDR